MGFRCGFFVLDGLGEVIDFCCFLQDLIAFPSAFSDKAIVFSSYEQLLVMSVIKRYNGCVYEKGSHYFIHILEVFVIFELT